VLAADKVDAFLYDASRDSLVAVGVSTQPLSALEKRFGVDGLPVSNGGRRAARDTAPRVREILQRARRERRNRPRLYIAKRIASAHGGDLTADRYAGKGARFTLRIPAAE
jgi:hypothetical protein